MLPIAVLSTILLWILWSLNYRLNMSLGLHHCAVGAFLLLNAKYVSNSRAWTPLGTGRPSFRSLSVSVQTHEIHGVSCLIHSGVEPWKM